MIKGCSKRVIVVKHPQGDAFEEAYFIVKEGKYKKASDKKHLLSEAEKILSGGKNESQRDKKALLLSRLGNVFSFVLGMGCAFILLLILINI